MPRYFFHVYYGDEPAFIDDHGEELADRHAAWKAATESSGQALRDLDGKLRPGMAWRMEVTDEFSNQLYAIHIHAEDGESI